MRRKPALLLIGLIVLACGSADGSATPSNGTITSTPPTPTSTATVGPSPSASVETTTPSPTKSIGLAPDTVAEVVTDNLRVRTQPGVTESALKLEPLLQRGTKLFIVDGPTEASGYRWYQVLTFDTVLELPGDEIGAEVERGWVAAAGTDGEVWLDVARLDCPPRPNDVENIVELDGATALGCFGGTPLTVVARLLDCDSSSELDPVKWCSPPDTGVGTVEPVWFDRTFEYLVPDEEQLDQGAVLELHADPNGTFPHPLPKGVPLRVTGQFGHPAASDCTSNNFRPDEPTVRCRTTFAVTAVQVVEP